jgi:ATP-dependent exoDNAse (exonuclease V) beta subunit
LVGVLPERSDGEYFGLVTIAKSRAEARRREEVAEFSVIPVVERRAWPLSASISFIAERYAQRYAERFPEEAKAPPERLTVAAPLAAPPGLSAETWGSLVHAVLEARFALRQGSLRLSPGLEDALASGLGSQAAIRSAIEAATRLAQVFVDSELGRRAQASRERYVELKVAIALHTEEPIRADGSRGSPRRAMGSIDLAFAEADRIVVVDYKTDASIATGAHDLQVAAYGRAASEIFRRPAESWVFYLYGGGRALLVNEDGSAPSLEDAPGPEPSLSRGFGPPLEPPTDEDKASFNR